MTDNIERTDSISVLSLKDRFANSFMQSSPKLIKSQVPKTVQVDEVFEVSTDQLEDIQSVTLVLWKSREDFEAAYFARSESLYDGYGVDPKQSM